MRTLTARQQKAIERGDKPIAAYATLTPHVWPIESTYGANNESLANEHVSSVVAIEDGTTTHRFRKNGNIVEVNSWTSSTYATADWEDWDEVYDASTPIGYIAAFTRTNGNVIICWNTTANLGNIDYSYPQGSSWHAPANLVTSGDTLTALEGVQGAGLCLKNETSKKHEMYFMTGGTFESVDEIEVPAHSGRPQGISGVYLSGGAVTFACEIEPSHPTLEFHKWIVLSTFTPTTQDDFSAGVWTNNIIMESYGESESLQITSAALSPYVYISYGDIGALLLQILPNNLFEFSHKYDGIGHGCPIDYRSGVLIFGNSYYSVIPFNGNGDTVDVINYVMDNENLEFTFDTRTDGLWSGLEEFTGTVSLSRSYIFATPANSLEVPSYDGDFITSHEYRITSWSIDQDGRTVIKANAGFSALNVPMPIGLYLKDDIERVLRILYGVIGIVVTTDSHTFFDQTAYPSGVGASGNLSSAIQSLLFQARAKAYPTTAGVSLVVTLLTTALMEIELKVDQLITRNVQPAGIIGVQGASIFSPSDDINNFIPSKTSYPIADVTKIGTPEVDEEESTTIYTLDQLANLAHDFGDVIQDRDLNLFRIENFIESYRPRGRKPIFKQTLILQKIVSGTVLDTFYIIHDEQDHIVTDDGNLIIGL